MNLLRLRFAFFAAGLAVMSFFLLRNQVTDSPDHRNTAHIFMLTTIEIWQQHGMMNYSAAPVQTWPEATAFNHYYRRLEDTSGNNYYISHPPLAFIANYAILQLTGLPVSQSSLQYILIFLLIAGGILLCYIASEQSKTNEHKTRYHIMLGVMAVYFLNPVNLFAHSQHNFSEIWGQFFFIATLAAWQFYLRSDRRIVASVFLFFSMFLLCATDWMGITLLLAFLMVYFKQRKSLHIRRGGLILASSVMLSGAVVAFQYISIAGVESFSRAIGIRFLERSGYFGNTYTDQQLHILNPESWLLLLQQMHNILTGPGYVMVLMVLVHLILRNKKTPETCQKHLHLAWVAPAIFFVILFSASVSHYIYMARFSPFIALFTGVLLEKLYEKIKHPIWITAGFLVLMHLAGFLSITTYKDRLPSPEYHQKELDTMAAKISENKLDSIDRPPYCEERDVIYLSWKSQRNVVWKQQP